MSYDNMNIVITYGTWILFNSFLSRMLVTELSNVIALFFGH